MSDLSASSPSPDPKNKKGVSMKDIARVTGVSQSTVSRALKDDSRIPEVTREKVRKCAQEMGYESHPYVGALMAHLRKTGSLPTDKANLAYIDFFWKEDALFDNNVNRGFYEGALARAEMMGYHLERYWAGSHETRSTIRRIIDSRGIIGFVALTPRTESHHRALKELEHLASAVVGSARSGGRHYATHDQHASTMLAYRTLWQRGYRKIGLLVDEKVEIACDYRFTAGYLAAHHNLQPEDTYHIGTFLLLHQAEIIREWLISNDCEVIISAFPIVYERIMEVNEAHSRNIRFVCLDCNPGSDSFSGINQHHRRVGAAALDLVTNQINRNEKGFPEEVKGVTTSGEWVDGAIEV